MQRWPRGVHLRGGRGRRGIAKRGLDELRALEASAKVRDNERSSQGPGSGGLCEGSHSISVCHLQSAFKNCLEGGEDLPLGNTCYTKRKASVPSGDKERGESCDNAAFVCGREDEEKKRDQ